MASFSRQKCRKLMESKIKEILNYLANIKVIAPKGAKIALPENCVGVEISTGKLRKPEQKPTKPSSVSFFCIDFEKVF